MGWSDETEGALKTIEIEQQLWPGGEGAKIEVTIRTHYESIEC